LICEVVFRRMTASTRLGAVTLVAPKRGDCLIGAVGYAGS